MKQKVKNMKRLVTLIILAEAVLLAFIFFGLKQDILIPGIAVVIEAALMIYLFDHFENAAQEQSIGVRNAVGATTSEAYLNGGIGLLIYDDNYEITWMSELFAERGIDKVGHRILSWIPEADDLIAGRSETAEVRINDKIYEIRRKEDAQVIYFRDITDMTIYRESYENEKIVIGLASFDNYEETVQYADEADSAAINMALRTPLNEYCAQFGIMLKRLSNSRYLMIMNEKIFSQMMNDHFSILNKVRRSAQKADVAITLSMAIARGSNNLKELDDMAANLMDLAETRGGDQVAVQEAGGDVKYFGGSTEAAEKRSRVRVRVMSHALRDLIQSSSNVIICGHKTADFDCIGSAICLSRMATALRKPVVIIAKTGGIEEKLSEAMKENEAQLKEEVTFVTEAEALNQLHDGTLVIMTDHHNVKQSNGAKVLEHAKKVIVIDHHRRSTDMGVKPVLLYIEAGASSTCELLTEMIPYVSTHTDISEMAATFMLAGMVIDTQKWTVRTGARTYDAASVLRQMGADPLKANDYLKDTYDEISLKSKVISAAERHEHGVVISAVKDRKLTRSLMSQIADRLLGVQGVQAAFVIANTSDSETCISARSAGRFNVQMIMESMGGGGHRTGAAMQRQKTTVDDIRSELLVKLDEYYKEEKPDESDS